MMPYVLHVAILTAVCFLFYKGLLYKQTFYRLNRWMLAGCLALSFILPTIKIPGEWSWREAWPALGEWGQEKHAADMSGVEQQQEQALAAPSKGGFRKVARVPAQDSIRTLQVGSALPSGSSNAAVSGATQGAKALLIHRIGQWILYSYWFGVLVLAMSFLFQLGILFVRAYSGQVIRDGRFRIVETKGNRMPCSFGNTIFINPDNYSWETYTQILLHEKIHVRGWHTLDIVLAELAVMLQWFNPFAWWYRREIENNLEFLTDAAVLQYNEVDASTYQLSLLRVSAPELPFSLTNNYNQSLLKKRIVMMNSKRSSRHTVWKYVFLIPLLTGLVCALNQPEAMGKTAIADKDTGSPKALAAGLAPVTTPAKSNPPSHATATTSKSPTHPPDWFYLKGLHYSSGRDLSSGSWYATAEGDILHFEIKADSAHFSWECEFDMSKPEFTHVGKTVITYKLAREAGTMFMNGEFDGQEWFGHFTFQPDPAYLLAFKEMGIDLEKQDLKGVFFISNVRKAYVRMVRENGYPDISASEVSQLAGCGVDKNDLLYWRKYVPDSKNVNWIALAKMENLDSSFVNGLKGLGYDHLDFSTLTLLKLDKVDLSYIRSISKELAISPTPVELENLRRSQVTPELIRKWKQQWRESLTAGDIKTLKDDDISIEFIKSLQAIGYTDITTDQLDRLQHLQITPDFIKQFNAIGYDSIPVNMLTSLKTAGVDAAYVTNMKQKGFDSGDLRKYIRLKQDFN